MVSDGGGDERNGQGPGGGDADITDAADQYEFVASDDEELVSLYLQTSCLERSKYEGLVCHFTCLERSKYKGLVSVFTNNLCWTCRVSLLFPHLY